MKATLIIPSQPTYLRKYKLAPRRRLSGLASGLRVMGGAHLCRVLNGKVFCDLRDILGARIETDDVQRIATALKLDRNEPGIIQRSSVA